MSEEFERRFERAMGLHLRQQAGFDARMDRLEAAQAETQKKLDQTAEMMTTLTRLTFDGFKVLRSHTSSQKKNSESSPPEWIAISEKIMGSTTK